MFFVRKESISGKTLQELWSISFMPAGTLRPRPRAGCRPLMEQSNGLPTTASNGAGTGMRGEGDTEKAQPIKMFDNFLEPDDIRKAIYQEGEPPLDPQPKNWLKAGKGDVPKKQRESERRLVHPVHVSHHVFACSLSPCLMHQLAHVRVAKG